MIDFYFWTTPNGFKPLLFLEETGLDYRIVPVNISQGEQFKPAFLKISPNNRIPAIVDHQPKEGHEPIPIFESGAILFYLAQKTGQFLPRDLAGRTEALQWLFWQMGGLGPMLGQHLHFSTYASEKLPYAIERYHNEMSRLYGVMDKHLADRDFLAGDYSIADIASYPWILRLEREESHLESLPNLKRWYQDISARPATIRAYDKGKEINTVPTITKESKSILFGQSSQSAG